MRYFLLALFCFNASGAWHVVSIPSYGYCYAEWPELFFQLKIEAVSVENDDGFHNHPRVNSENGDLFLEIAVPQNWLSTSSLQGEKIESNQLGNDTEALLTDELDIRIFPDDGEEETGFMTHEWIVQENENQTWAFLRWYGFKDYKERLKRWGLAKSEEHEVYVPEARIIVRWTADGRGGVRFRTGNDPDNGYQILDIPLWRTSNMMNKMTRCVGLMD